MAFGQLLQPDVELASVVPGKAKDSKKTAIKHNACILKLKCTSPKRILAPSSLFLNRLLSTTQRGTRQLTVDLTADPSYLSLADVTLTSSNGIAAQAAGQGPKLQIGSGVSEDMESTEADREYGDDSRGRGISRRGRPPGGTLRSRGRARARGRPPNSGMVSRSLKSFSEVERSSARTA